MTPSHAIRTFAAGAALTLLVACSSQAERLAPVIDSFRQAGADFVVPSVADLAPAIGAIEEAADAGRSPGGAATVALRCPGA